MRSYEEFSEDVFREAERRRIRKKKRAAIIRRYTLAVASMLAIVLTGVFVLKNKTAREALDKKYNDNNIITDEPVVTTGSSLLTTATGDIPVTTSTAVTAQKDDIRTTTVRTTDNDQETETTETSGTQTTENKEDTETTTSAESESETQTTTAKESDETTRRTTTTRRPATTRRTTTTRGGADTTRRTTTAVRTSEVLRTTTYVSTTTVRYTVTSALIPATTTTAVPSTPSGYPDIQIPASSVESLGNASGTVNYTYRKTMSYVPAIDGYVCRTVVNIDGTEYDCDVYTYDGWPARDYVLVCVWSTNQWLVYQST